MDEIHDRHFYHILYDGETQEKWEHVEADPSILTEHTPDVILFDLRWIDLASERPELAEGHDAFLDTLIERLVPG